MVKYAEPKTEYAKDVKSPEKGEVVYEDNTLQYLVIAMLALLIIVLIFVMMGVIRKMRSYNNNIPVEQGILIT